MNVNTEQREHLILGSQRDELFKSLKTSAPLGIFASIMVVNIISTPDTLKSSFTWVAIMISIYAYRLVLGVVFSNLDDKTRNQHNWLYHYEVASYIAALGWGLSLFLVYPESDPDKLILLAWLIGISSFSAQTMSVHQRSMIGYQLLLTLAVVARLIFAEEAWAMPMMVSFVVFSAVTVVAGHGNAVSFAELVGLRFEADHDNFLLLSKTEKAAGMGYFKWRPSDNYFQVSRHLQEMLRLEDRRVKLSRAFRNMEAGETERLKDLANKVMKSGLEEVTEFRIRHPGSEHWRIFSLVMNQICDSKGEVQLLGTLQDVSRIRVAEERVYDMAYFDELTGLANRAHFRQHLTKELSHAERNSLKFAVFYIDLDGFKEINDTLGHESGDLFLQEFSSRLEKVVRQEDFVARLGGDEFCVVLRDLEEGTAVARAAERCLSMTDKPIRISNQNFSPRMSIGIAVYPDDGADVTSLLRAADTAMYSAKQGGKHCFAFYESEMTRAAEERFQLESDLKIAVAENQFELWYQPKVSLKDGSMSGVEALIRWFHPEKGQIRPDQFIDAAERIGLIGAIGEWVMTEAATQMKLWKEQGIYLTMAVNISSSHFSSPGFTDKVRAVRENFGLSDGEFEIEITESLSRDPLQHTEVSKVLREAGNRVAIDDFGTGYSSLSVLIQLQADTLKIDRSFISDLSSDSASALMVSAIISIGLGLGYDIVAEGVETGEQVEFLATWGCPYVQGFLFSPPVPAAAIPAMAERGFSVAKTDNEQRRITMFS